MDHAILLISCPDQKGITASVANFIYANGGNIIHADQHIDDQNDTFFMRIEWALSGFAFPQNRIAEQFAAIARKFRMTWSLHFTKEEPKIAIFVSKYFHCLQDLLWRIDAGQLAATVACIVSNHAAGKKLAESFRVPFYAFPITRTNKAAQEKKQLALLKKEGIECVVLARYGQILTKGFIKEYSNRIINIHHSFLPAFAGKSPYAQAYRKGVKIIGATSHYVIEALDEGPIIEQDTVRISHRDSLEDLVRKGEDLEKVVLSRALRWHLERKILVYDNKTVVFA